MRIVVYSTIFFLLFLFVGDKRFGNRDYLENSLSLLCSNFEQDITNIHNQFPEFTSPNQAAFRDFIMTRDPALGFVPAVRRIQAYKETDRIYKSMHKKSGDYALNWDEVPSNIGGRTRALMFDPNDPTRKKAWAAGVTGGLWYNNDVINADSMWVPVNDFWDNLAVSCITYDPVSPNIFYAGTGEPQTALVTYRESSGRGLGIWKSTDGGVTWQIIPSTTDFAYITDIRIRNESGVAVIYAGVVSGTYKGTDYQSVPTDGLYRSTDNGNSWTQVFPIITGENKPYAPADIEIGADGRIFVGTMRNLNNAGGGTILFSDDGFNWTIFDDYKYIIESDQKYNIPGRVMLAAAPSDANRIYALYDCGFMSGQFILGCNYILRSDNKGINWQKVTIPPFQDDTANTMNWAYISWHALAATVDPYDPDRIFIGGADLHRSTDAGLTWDWLSDMWGGHFGNTNDSIYVHADQHTIVFKPGSSDEFLAASDGGVFYTGNANDSVPVFKEVNHGFNTLQFYTCAIHPHSSKRYYMGGLQDNGTLVYRDSPLVVDDMASSGDGAYCFFDKETPDIQITTSQYNYFYLSYDNLQSIFEYPYYQGGTFINPVDYDSKNNILFANATSFSTYLANYIVIIRQIGGNPNGHFEKLSTDVVVAFSSVKVSPNTKGNASTLFLGTMSGRLFKVYITNNSTIVNEIGSADFPVSNISSIDIGSSDHEILVTFSNYGVSSIWYTSNSGLTWSEKEGNLPDMPVRWGLFHPNNTSYVALATEIGVWTTNDLKAENVEWKPQLNNFANVRVDMLSFRKSDNTLLAATHGRGLFTSKFNVPEEPGADQNEFITIFPNPSADIVFLNFNSGFGMVELAIYDVDGKKLKEAQFNNETGSLSTMLNISNFRKGVYFFYFNAPEFDKTYKVVKY